MAYRNPARAFLFAEDPSDSGDAADILHPYINEEPPRPQFRVNGPHPASTDFGLGTLSAHLRNEGETKKLKVEQLRHDPALAAAEVEQQEIRRLVNGTKFVSSSVSNGRLTVKEYGMGYYHNCWTYPSDEEHGSCSDDNGGASNFKASIRSTGNRTKMFDRRRSKSMHARGGNLSARQTIRTYIDPAVMADRLSYERMFGEYGEDLRDDIGYPDVAERLVLNGRAVHESTGDSQSKFTVGSSAADLLDRMKARMSKQPLPGSSSLRAVPRRLSADPAVLGDLSNRIAARIPVPSGNERSLSFEKHADAARQFARSSKGNLDKVLGHDDEEVLESSSDTSLPRKVTFNITTQVLNDVGAYHTAQDAGSGTQMDLSKVDNGSLPSCNSAGTMTGGDSYFQDGQVLPDAQPGQITDSAAEETHSDVELVSGSSTLPTRSDIPGSSVSKVKRLTGIDTFYSASSDNGSSSSEGCEDKKEDGMEQGQDNSTRHLAPKQHETAKQPVVTVFDYGMVVPEKLPQDIVVARANCKKIWSLVGHNSDGQPDLDKEESWLTTQFSMDELNPNYNNVLGAANEFGHYPRKIKDSDIPKPLEHPPGCHPSPYKTEFPPECLPYVCHFLSNYEVRNLRLVSRATAAIVLPLMVRSTVVKFGQPLFGSTDSHAWDEKSNYPSPSSILQTCGGDINKFGISFEFDPHGLANAEHKTIEEEIDAWFGNYCWPKAKYPRFAQLKELEDLVDSNRPLLKNTMSSLTNVTELAVSIDSGHGWLNGPDISDMALLRDQEIGTKIFGKAHSAADKDHEWALRKIFMWAQLNTINAYAKHVANIGKNGAIITFHRRYIRNLRVRELDSYLVQSAQHDFRRSAHVGGELSNDMQQAAIQQGGVQPHAGPQLPTALPLNWALTNGTVVANPAQPPANAQPNLFQTVFGLGPQAATGNNGNMGFPAIVPPLRRHHVRIPPVHSRRAKEASKSGLPVYPQWPLIFSGYNIAAELGGNQSFLQDEVSLPGNFPYMPGDLTETHVQWLMETLWAQRAFLSNYTTSIITNAKNFVGVQSLVIAKLSSGLIPHLAQKEFWLALPNLRRLTLKVIPDWRQEHIPGDKQYFHNMLISPVEASVKLASLLENHIANIESLSTLRIGFVGGGEHQTGIFGRNRHILPAPVTYDSQAWLYDTDLASRNMIVFNHIRDLTFENCWFSPNMLEAFMQKSQDTSLHHITLDSVSLTGIHDARPDGPLTVTGHDLKVEHSASEWIHETIPKSACWVNTLDKIVPGKSVLDRQYEAGIIDETAKPRPERSFRGNVKKITLKSCGYVKISGAQPEQFSQMGLVKQTNPWGGMDQGLAARKKLFYVSNHRQDQPGWSQREFQPILFLRKSRDADIHEEMVPKCIMMSDKDPRTRKDYFGLGKLTQTVHPIEKRILERAWGMRFGWGDTLERWAAVEDGWYEGGTGRFSGMIERGDDNDN